MDWILFSPAGTGLAASCGQTRGWVEEEGFEEKRKSAASEVLFVEAELSRVKLSSAKEVGFVVDGGAANMKKVSPVYPILASSLGLNMIKTISGSLH